MLGELRHTLSVRPPSWFSLLSAPKPEEFSECNIFGFSFEASQVCCLMYLNKHLCKIVRMTAPEKIAEKLTEQA